MQIDVPDQAFAALTQLSAKTGRASQAGEVLEHFFTFKG